MSRLKNRLTAPKVKRLEHCRNVQSLRKKEESKNPRTTKRSRDEATLQVRLIILSERENT